jgi:hypothetical protein
MIPPIDYRFTEKLVEDTWRLPADHGYQPSTDPEDVSEAVYRLSEVRH